MKLLGYKVETINAEQWDSMTHEQKKQLLSDLIK